MLKQKLNKKTTIKINYMIVTEFEDVLKNVLNIKNRNDFMNNNNWSKFYTNKNMLFSSIEFTPIIIIHKIISIFNI